MSDGAAKPTRRLGRMGWALVPVAVFGAIAVMLAVALRGGDPSVVPSVLIGKPVPQVDFPPLDGLMANGAQVPGVKAADLAAARVKVVNFWASWCGPCILEHPYLMVLAGRRDIDVVGVNYKDAPPGGLRFLTRHGNPYDRVGVDATGRGAIEWGVYGMPETFVVDAKGQIVFKHVGAIDAAVLRDKLVPAIERAKAAR